MTQSGSRRSRERTLSRDCRSIQQTSKCFRFRLHHERRTRCVSQPTANPSSCEHSGCQTRLHSSRAIFSVDDRLPSPLKTVADVSFCCGLVSTLQLHLTQRLVRIIARRPGSVVVVCVSSRFQRTLSGCYSASQMTSSLLVAASIGWGLCRTVTISDSAHYGESLF